MCDLSALKHLCGFTQWVTCVKFYTSWYFITARKWSLRRLCFYTCLSVHRGGLQAYTQGGGWGPHRGGVSQHALRQTPPTPSRRLLLRVVRILLECLLVIILISQYKACYLCVSDNLCANHLHCEQDNFSIVKLNQITHNCYKNNRVFVKLFTSSLQTVASSGIQSGNLLCVRQPTWKFSLSLRNASDVNRTRNVDEVNWNIPLPRTLQGRHAKSKLSKL